MLTPEELRSLPLKEQELYVRDMAGAKGKESLIYLCRDILGYKEIEDDVHGKLEEVLHSSKKRKIILLPRGSFKSTMGNIGYTIHSLLNNPDLRILIDSEVLENSTKFLTQIKHHLRQEEFIRLYGDLIDTKRKETAREFTIKTRENQNLKEPSVYATGIGTVNVGMHYDRIICDDLHSEKNTSTSEQIDKVKSHYRLLLSLLEPDGQLVIIGTRWTFWDVYNMILEDEADKNWEVYIESAIRKDGSLFFPKRLSREFLDAQRRSQRGYVFSCQYLNYPVSDETAVFRKEDFRYWGVESDPWPLSDGRKVLLNAYVLIDRAFSTKESADYTGIVCAGVSSTGNIYVLEATRKKCGLQALADYVFMLLSKYGERIKNVNIETINWEETYQFFQEYMGKKNRFFVINRLTPDRGMSKNGRIESALAARYANGAVYHKKGMVDLEDELVSFPLGKFDDLCFVAGTKIATPEGDRNIEEIKAGERVITPFGTRKVVASGLTGERKVVEFRSLLGTGNHPVFADGEFKPMDTLTYLSCYDSLSLGGLIIWRYKKLLSSMESNTGLWGRENITYLNRKTIKDGRILKDFMWRFGSFIRRRKFQKAIMFTIKTATLLITTLATWSAYQLGNIGNRLKELIKKSKENILKGFDRLLRHGTNLTKGVNGIVQNLKDNGRNQENFFVSAFSVEKILRPLTGIGNFVPCCVNGIPKRLSVLNADGAVGNLKTVNIKPGKIKPVPGAVGQSWLQQKVYNLTVEKDHVYYANGILVSNCDSLAYLPTVMGKPSDPKMEDVDNLEYQSSGWFGNSGY